MSAQRFLVWFKESGESWQDTGEGPMTRLQADRIARELELECHCLCVVLPVGTEPAPDESL